MEELIILEEKVDELLKLFENLQELYSRTDIQLFVVENIIVNNSSNIDYSNFLTLHPSSYIDDTLLIYPETIGNIGTTIRMPLKYKDDIIPKDIDIKTITTSIINPQGIRENIITVDYLTNKLYTLDISSYFIKDFEEYYIKGYIAEAKILNTNNVPREGILNERKSTGNLNYLGFVKDDLLYIYPDYRNARYAIKLHVWLGNFNDARYILRESTFIVSEYFINTITHLVDIMGETRAVNLRNLYITTVQLSNINYRFVKPSKAIVTIKNHICSITPNKELLSYSIWIEVHTVDTDIAICRIRIDANEILL